MKSISKELFLMIGADLSNYLKLSLQRALLGNITPNIRCVAVILDAKNIQLSFYYDGEFTDCDEELASEVETEIIADFDDDFIISTHLERLDYPKPIKINNGYCVYLRKE